MPCKNSFFHVILYSYYYNLFHFFFNNILVNDDLAPLLYSNITFLNGSHYCFIQTILATVTEPYSFLGLSKICFLISNKIAFLLVFVVALFKILKLIYITEYVSGKLTVTQIMLNVFNVGLNSNNWLHICTALHHV